MPWSDSVVRAGSDLSRTRHLFSRKHIELPVRVVSVDDPDNGGYLLIFGDIVPEHCLVRIHSRCLYGESLGSDDCDCGSELRKALDLIQSAGAGILVYLEQEGRGAGLIAKACGYRYSEQTGADTFASYEALGYGADPRRYDTAAATLAGLGLRSVRLLTNNPDKIAAARAAGLVVNAVPLHTAPRSERARRYFEAKQLRGHQLPPHVL